MLQATPCQHYTSTARDSSAPNILQLPLHSTGQINTVHSPRYQFLFSDLVISIFCSAVLPSETPNCNAAAYALLAPHSGYPPTLTSQRQHTSWTSLTTSRLRADVTAESAPRSARPQEFRAASACCCPAGRGEALALPSPLLPGPEHCAGGMVGVEMCAYFSGRVAVGGG